MTPPTALASGAKGVKMNSLSKDFESITITGYYTRDIRFPVFHMSQSLAAIFLINRIDIFTR